MRVERQGCAGRDGALGLFAWVSVLPFFAACGSGDGPPTASEPLPEGVDTAVQGMRTFVTRDGIRRAVVEADTAEWREGNEIHLRRMTLTFFDVSGLESTEVTAEFGIFYQLSGDLDAERQVVVEDRVDDQRLETERLEYRNLEGRLYGDTAFRLLRGVEGLTLEGTGFESDPALDSIIVLNQEGEMLPGVAFTESVPLPPVPAGDTEGEAVASEPVTDDPALGDSTAAEIDPAAGDSAAAGVDPGAVETDPAAAETDLGAEGIDPDVLPAQDSAAADSTAAVPDSVEALPDTTAAAVPPDTTAAPPDTTTAVTPPDSVAAPPDTTTAARR